MNKFIEWVEWNLEIVILIGICLILAVVITLVSVHSKNDDEAKIKRCKNPVFVERKMQIIGPFSCGQNCIVPATTTYTYEYDCADGKTIVVHRRIK